MVIFKVAEPSIFLLINALLSVNTQPSTIVFIFDGTYNTELLEIVFAENVVSKTDRLSVLLYTILLTSLPVNTDSEIVVLAFSYK